VFTTAACNPYGAELACVSTATETAGTQVNLTAGTTYLITFFTDADATTMVNPDIAISLAPTSGGSCASPANLTGAAFPYVMTGTFTDSTSAAGGSCDTTPTNIVWYTFTPTVSKPYVITATNATTTLAYSRLAIFETAACAPHGTQFSCTTAAAKTVTTTGNLVAGTTYLLAFYTDGDTYTMVNPSITIGDLPAGSTCSAPVNLTGATFPYASTGTFTDDGVGGTCDNTATNTIYYTFTPATTQSYTITAVNATTTLAYSRLAIFETAACAPLGTEVVCAAASGKTATTTNTLTAGTTYLILFYTDGDTYTMVNPTITITP
jgi:hypothetical protein